jgi:hypothetical protein
MADMEPRESARAAKKRAQIRSALRHLISDHDHETLISKNRALECLTRLTLPRLDGYSSNKVRVFSMKILYFPAMTVR